MSQEDSDTSGGSDNGPHLVKVIKNQQGFGFNVRGQVSEGGQLKSIGGDLYAPMQYISQVLEGGPAEEAGLKVGDRILEVNSQSVEGAEHQLVVQLIRNSGKEVSLVVISVTDEEARRLEPDNSGMSAMDYFERRSVPISIPDTKKMTDEAGKEYVGFNICLANKVLVTRRYREFDSLNTNLKRQFNDFIFPKLPGKRPFALNETQVDARRRGLEDYLDKVCSARVIFESDLLQDFLELKKQSTSGGGGTESGKKAEAVPQEKKVNLRVTLPDHTVATVTINEHARTPEVFELVAKKAGLSSDTKKYFGLFERKPSGFDRKLQSTEFPHQLNVHKHSSGDSCIYLRKWLFSKAHEVAADTDSAVLNFFYNQAADDVSKGKISADDELAKLKSLKSQSKKQEFLNLARSLPDYNSIKFPHCACDARKVGHVIVTISLETLKLKACSTEGVPESQEHVFTWSMVSNYEADLEEEAFTFQYTREGKEPRWVKVFSPYYRYMEQCVDRINQEILWKKPDSSKGTPKPSPRPARGKDEVKVAAITNDDL